jgi:hypothetical protein
MTEPATVASRAATRAGVRDRRPPVLDVLEAAWSGDRERLTRGTASR